MPRPTAAKPGWPLIVAILLAATLIRTLPLLDNRFHPDEALYGSFARRIASGQDPLLTGVLVDKPPLGFYLMAFGLLLGDASHGELGARLPSLYASLVSVALLFVLARRLYGQVAALVAAALLAASPLAVLFAITLFLDPLLTAAVLWAFCAAARSRWRSLAVAMAIALAIKQTALVFVPLALALSLLRLRPGTAARQVLTHLWRGVQRLAPALALSAVAIFSWDAARHPVIGLWRQGHADNMPGRLVRANEVTPRALAWAGLLHYTTASTALNGLAVAGLAGLLIAGARRPSRGALADGLLAGYALLYLGAYWLLAFNVWDRYLLPLLPVLCLLAARSWLWLAARVLGWLRPRAGPSLARLALAGLAVLLGVSLLPGAVHAARSGYPVGGDHGAYDGVDDAARFLSGLPEGSVLYDHWLSWQWNFYLFEAPVYVAWLPSPDVFAADLQAFGSKSPRYLVVPSWEQDSELRAAAAGAGYTFVARHYSYRRDGSLSLTVYELAPTHPATLQATGLHDDSP
jgi:4-amino-4-deoxy-L-arabinose transferase-like glycosyltransferase